MSEGKKIEVRIAAVGGDQAAAEVRKVESALGLVIETEEDLARKRAGFLSAAEAEVAEVERLVRAAQKESAATKQNTASTEESTAATKRAKTAKDQLADSSRKVTASAVSMRTGIQNAAFQFQDMAVQAEMGVSATRIFSQQVPQLLGGFGAIGALAGAVVGIGVPLAAALFNSGKEAEDAKPKVDDLNEALDDHKDYLKDVAAAKAAADNEAWLESLDAEEDYYDRINERLARKLALEAKLRALKEGGDSAEREARIAEIEADPNKSEEDKIKETAAIRDEESRAKAESQKAEIVRQAQSDKAAAEAAQAAADRQQKDLETARKAREEAEAAAKALDDRRVAGEQGGRKIPELEKAIKNQSATVNTLQDPELGSAYNPEAARAAEAKLADLKQQLEAAKKADAELPAVKEAADPVNKNVDDKRSAEKKQEAEAESARKAAETAFGKSQISDALAREAPSEIDRRADAERQQRQTRESAALRALADKKKREDAAEQRRKDQEEERNIQREGRGIPGQVKDGLTGARGTRVTRDVEEATARLKDGATGDEYASLGAALESFVGASQSLSAARKQELSNLAKTVNNLAERLRRLEGK